MNRILIVICLINIIHSVPLSEFFPYGTTVNDQQFPPNDDESTNVLPLPYIFPYFNNNHRQIYLANNGLFSFLGPISQYVPTSFPIGNDNRLIAGFWSDIDTRGNIPSGNNVYYQIYSNPNNMNVFEKVTTYVQSYFPGERSFTPTMVITGTWFRVGAYYMQTNLTNTFQIVLATDEIRSFAFLLYHDLQWASPRTNFLNNLNNSNELGGQAGFNAGDGIIFEMLPYSRTSSVRQLVNISNVNVPGLFVFRTDTDTITLGGCGNGSNWIFRPRRGSQLGLTPITIQGPCFTNISEENVKCRFGQSTIVDAIIIDQFQAICLTPSVPLPNVSSVSLSIDGGITFVLFPQLFTYTPAEFGLSAVDNAQVIIVNQTDMMIATYEEILLRWYLSEPTIKSWPKNTIRLEIQMSTVTLNEFNGGILSNTTAILQTNLTAKLGLQHTTITIPSLSSTNNLPTVFFRILARDSSTNRTYASLNSPSVVLHADPNDPVGICNAWAEMQPLPITWNEN